MEIRTIVGFIALGLSAVFGLILLYLLFGSRRDQSLKSLMASGGAFDVEVKRKIKENPESEEAQWIKERAKQKVAKKGKPTLEERLYHAGLFTPKDKRKFFIFKRAAPVITTVTAFVLVYSFSDIKLALMSAIVGLLWGFQLPNSYLDRIIAKRAEEIFYYLPLVVEQIVIGVSSSLEVGPCIQRIIMMADQRGTHNVVTELLKQAHYYVKSGVSLQDALTEIGIKSGNTELKHAFMSLAQVSRHGGEISKQLQELANAVAAQREAKIEGKIRKLELEATIPVGLTMLGFLMIFFAGLVVSFSKVF